MGEASLCRALLKLQCHEALRVEGHLIQREREREREREIERERERERERDDKTMLMLLIDI